MAAPEARLASFTNSQGCPELAIPRPGAGSKLRTTLAAATSGLDPSQGSPFADIHSPCSPETRDAVHQASRGSARLGAPALWCHTAYIE
jgi:hypothetical protein